MVEVIYIKKPPEEMVSTKTISEDLGTLCKNFIVWMRAAKPGDSYLYYEGEYISGRIARVAFDSYEQGEVELVQKKLGNRYEFWAQKKKRIW